MKHIPCLLLATIFCAIGICSTIATQACDPAKPCIKTNDTAASKKAPVKISPAAAQPVKKQTSKKDEKKTESDIVSPLSWRPTLLY